MTIQNQWNLPADVHTHCILKWLSVEEICRSSRVCKQWKTRHNDQKLWKFLIQRDYPSFVPATHGASFDFKKHYKICRQCREWPTILVQTFGGPVPFAAIPTVNLGDRTKLAVGDDVDYIHPADFPPGITIMKGIVIAKVQSDGTETVPLPLVSRPFITFFLQRKDNPQSHTVCTLHRHSNRHRTEWYTGVTIHEIPSFFRNIAPLWPHMKSFSVESENPVEPLTVESGIVARSIQLLLAGTHPHVQLYKKPTPTPQPGCQIS